MIELLAAVFGLSLLDTLNPSAIAVTLYLLLAGEGYGRKVLTYAAGMVSSNFALGAVLMLGLGSWWDRLDGTVAYTIQGIAGAVLMLYAFLAPKQPQPMATRIPRSRGLGAVFVLGATVTGIEFSTAVPYLGAIALMTNADLPPPEWRPILVAYNVVFVLPPLLLLGVSARLGSRVSGRLERYQEKLARGSREALLWIGGIVGFFLLADGLAHFEFFGLVDIADLP